MKFIAMWQIGSEILDYKLFTFRLYIKSGPEKIRAAFCTVLFRFRTDNGYRG